MALGHAAALYLLVAVSLAEICSDAKDNCNDGKKRIVKISCQLEGCDTGGCPPCACEGSTANGNVNTEKCSAFTASYQNKTYNDVIADGCKGLCEEFNTTCLYYKWRQGRDERTCSLMDKTQCTDEPQEPPEDCTVPATCVSDSINCDNGPDPKPPTGTDCRMNLPAHNPYNLLWACTNAHLADANVDVYETPDQEMSISAQTICRNAHP